MSAETHATSANQPDSTSNPADEAQPTDASADEEGTGEPFDDKQLDNEVITANDDAAAAEEESEENADAQAADEVAAESPAPAPPSPPAKEAPSTPTETPPSAKDMATSVTAATAASATPAATHAASSATPERVYVEIPRAKPGQGYRAPKNYQQPGLELLSKIIIVLMCISLPIAPAVIFVMILAYSHAIQQGLLWLWIVMILLIEPMALLLAWGVGREALGVAGATNYIRRK